MPYEIEFQDSAAEEIEQYLNKRFPEGPDRDEAIKAIEEGLQRLAEDPISLGRTPHPVFSYPTFTFKTRIQNMERLFRVVFCYGEDERAIWILAFKPLVEM